MRGAFAAAALFLAAGCGDSAVNACYNVCQTLSMCFTNSDLASCRASCDRAPAQCRNDNVVATMLDACAQSKCDRVVSCLISVGVQYPQCNPGPARDAGP